MTDGAPRKTHTIAAIRDGARSERTGLAVITQLALAWGVDRDATEKTVWALMPVRLGTPRERREQT
ncbi:hypothetical protein Amsp01_042190 [Amycolatopsis sp. NBRC 101858]|uniref:hypothetical protein n=1 Tax=Amycolatopsis sp. NBRC 101858 TaxID=3032200 RepID=UPI0024A0D5F2|nr:hypothetical protein [Amycolatopsis sp. NBRC 101858]GLY38195.1 hypothetical protein Amsp01_042190 [Amycolatopsis sp. NBRC 101858]